MNTTYFVQGFSSTNGRFIETTLRASDAGVVRDRAEEAGFELLTVRPQVESSEHARTRPWGDDVVLSGRQH
ncbi:MAG: hypothetical protein L6Q35_02985 [Phycisphaerales bacterium]|nr:hypothetical protein [Phycisphaerales bacterium]